MLFFEPVFIFFLIIVKITISLVKNDKKKLVLLISSYFFYGFWDWRFLGLIWISTLIDFITGNLIYRSKKNNLKIKLLTISIISNLLVLCIFKYYNFFIGSLNKIINQPNFFDTINIILPVGISFYTFQSMAYSIDIYQGRIKPTKNLIDFSNFIAFFPQLVAGPIEKAKNLLPQLENFTGCSSKKFSRIIILLFLGYLKKVILADNIGVIVDINFLNYENLNSFDILFTLYLFSLQIYFDFSGYSDFARGIALIFGVNLIKNFNQPYFSKSPKEFWTRWHISLSNWLKDYVYIPLGGNKNSFLKTNFNVLTTMLLGGLWHGASWNFVIWGFVHGLYLVVNNITLKVIKINYFLRKEIILMNFVKIILTFFLILVTWLPFRSTNSHITYSILESLFQLNFIIDFDNLKLAFILLFILLAIDLPAYIFKSHYYLEKLPKLLFYSLIILISVFGTLINLFINSIPNKPFIYFQF
mgnify:CR=1 FL=1